MFRLILGAVVFGCLLCVFADQLLQTPVSDFVQQSGRDILQNEVHGTYWRANKREIA